MALQFGIGIDHFGELRRRGAHFIDKTGFIAELFNRAAISITLITRPRRFGKTLNLSMLQHFLAPIVDGKLTKDLFKGLWVESQPELMARQGQSPVIFVTFKDVKASSLESAYRGFSEIIAQLYKNHLYLREQPYFRPEDQIYFDQILMKTASMDDLGFALKRLSQFLEEYHHQKPWILIDEYDAPLHSAYFYDYHQELIPLMRNLLSSALKTNPHLDRAVLTGVTRIAKESLFSGLNNFTVYTIMDPEYSAQFGFTEPEVELLLKDCDMTSKAAEIKTWYNGYLCGDTVLYNPWSMISCLSRQGSLQAYWVNSGGTDLIQKRLAMADATVKMALESLLKNEPIEVDIHLHWTFDSLSSQLASIASLLLTAGYLKAISKIPHGSHMRCLLAVPNQEVLTAYQDTVMAWFEATNQEDQYHALLKTLVQGDIATFHRHLNTFLAQTASYFDVTGMQPERFYHGFVLGLVVALAETHVIESNKESGLGRYDVMIVPKDVTKPGFVIEFKVALEGEDLKLIATEALDQVRRLNYAVSLQQRGISRIALVGMAFCGKKAEMVWEEL